MKLKRLFLRYSLNLRKYKIKAENLEQEDFQNAYVVVSRRLYRIIHLRNLVVFCLVFTIFVFSMFISSFRGIEAYYNKDKPLAGGTYQEGNLGKFSRLNPLYSATNTNDENAVKLIFSGLMKRGGDRNLETDLADKWSLSQDKKTYTFELKKGVKWHDGKELDADDVIFTVQLVQNPDTRSSLYESWKGVKAEKTPSGGVRFILNEPSDSFLENTTLKILPKHILEKIPPANMQTVDFNTSPLGTGPYRFENLTKQSGRETLVLTQFDKYYGKKPYISKVVLESFQDEKEMLDEYNKRNLKGIGNPTQSAVEKQGKGKSSLLYEYALPRYVALFFNTEQEFLKDKNLRLAISQSIDRKEVLDAAANGRGIPAYQPIAPSLASAQNIKVESKGDADKAIETLKEAGYVLENGQLKNQGKEIILKIATPDTEEMKKVSKVIADKLKKLGIKTEIKSENMNVLQNGYIRPRNYDILIIGEDLGTTPDLFSFWHSSQAADPGLNFSKYKSRKLDKLIEVARKTADPKEKELKLEEVQKVILEDVPAVYLYNPFYVFMASDKVKGVENSKIAFPSDRFNLIGNWYLKANRVTIDD